MKSLAAKKVASKETTEVEELLTEVPPAKKDVKKTEDADESSDEDQLLTEVPTEDPDELIVEQGPPPQAAPPPVHDEVDIKHHPKTQPKAPRAKKEGKPKSKKTKKPEYTPAQIKKLRGEFSRRTLLTRFGISF